MSATRSFESSNELDVDDGELNEDHSFNDDNNSSMSEEHHSKESYVVPVGYDTGLNGEAWSAPPDGSKRKRKPSAKIRASSALVNTVSINLDTDPKSVRAAM